MKLISINAEGYRHMDKVTNFLHKENADIVCMQESHKGFDKMLKKIGYQTTFMPRCSKNQDGTDYIDGTLFASKTPFFHKNYYYYKPTEELPKETRDKKTGRNIGHQGLILAELSVGDKLYYIGTTHFTWTPKGNMPSDAQRKDWYAFRDLINSLPPHIMCGDFNIPRDHSNLYKELTKIYTDNIPIIYKSSLDASLHRLGNDSDKKEIFDKYMVDYIFSQTPYKVTDVRLEFGISDHSAIIAEISTE